MQRRIDTESLGKCSTARTWVTESVKVIKKAITLRNPLNFAILLRNPMSHLMIIRNHVTIQPYDWQCQILLNYEAGFQTAAACANFTGKTSTLFPIASLWLLYSFPRARAMYLSSSGAQVRNQFFASLSRFRYRPAFAGGTWLENEVRSSMPVIQ